MKKVLSGFEMIASKCTGLKRLLMGATFESLKVN